MAEDVTRHLNKMGGEDSSRPDELLSVIYAELRRIAGGKMARERPGHTLQATELVHEAYLRLGDGQQWRNRQHFFGAAGEAMRRILIDHARRRLSIKRRGGLDPLDIEDVTVVAPLPDERLLEIHEHLDRLAREDPERSEVIKLTYFVGLTQDQAADALGISERTVRRHLELAKVWLYRAVEGEHGPGEGPQTLTDQNPG